MVLAIFRSYLFKTSTIWPIIMIIISLNFNLVMPRKHRLIVTQDSRSMFSISSFGFLANGLLEVSVKNFQLIPEDFFVSPIQIGFTLIRTQHIENPLNKGVHLNSRECYLHDPSITHAKQFVIMEIDLSQKRVILKCQNTQDLIFHTIKDVSQKRIFKRGVAIMPPNSTNEKLLQVVTSSSPMLPPIINNKGSFSSSVDLSAVDSSQSDNNRPDLDGFPEIRDPVQNDTINSIERFPGRFENNGKKFQSCSRDYLPMYVSQANDQGTIFTFNFTLMLTRTEQEAFYFLTFHNCKASLSRFDPMIPWVINMDVDVTEINYPDNYLSAHLMPLPQLYFGLSIVFLLFGIIWLNFILQQRNNVLKIHHLMTALVFVKTVALISRGINYHFIALDGSPMEAWAYIYYTTRLLKGALFFITLVLIGSGWTFIKHMLNFRDKKLVLIIICLQLVANLAEIVYDESVEGDTKRAFWHDLVGPVDLVCCSAILFPIVWSVKHLQEASRTDGKAAINLRKMELFRHFYFAILCYIYFTRIISYLVTLMITFKYFWVTVLMEEGATLVFFVITGYFFQPISSNPYLLISQDEDFEMEDVLFARPVIMAQSQKSENISGTVTRRWQSTSDDSTSDNQRLIKLDLQTA